MIDTSNASYDTYGATEIDINNEDYTNWENLEKEMEEHIRYRNGYHRDERPIVAERKL